MKIKSKNRGITLISLVITIIVMLILVGVSITLAVNGGLFEYAGNAVGDTKNAIAEENEIGNGGIEVDGEKYGSINEYLYGKPIEGHDGEMFSPIYKETTEITQKEGDKTYTAWIPKGFAVGTSEEISKISTGLVIRDAEGNEFVWIPVEVVKEGENVDSEKSIASFYRSNWTSSGRGTTKYTATSGSSYNEPLSGGYADEKTDYEDMLKSVYTYEGFYIGRYEAGTETPRTNTSNDTSKMVVQRDKYPYTYVVWGESMINYTNPVSPYGEGALYLCKNFYTSEDKVGVTSTLCYGVMWDAMLDFIIKDSSYSVTNSTTWGNYKNNACTIDRINASYSEDYGKTWKKIDDEENDQRPKTDTECILLTTGANDNFSAKNIFDVAGNVWEWTNEAYSANYRVYRGGFYYYDGDISPASSRYRLNPNVYNDSLGFRPALYITNND